MGCNCCHHETEKACSTVHAPASYKIYLPAMVSFAMVALGMGLSYSGIDFPREMVFAWYLLAYLPVGLPVLKEALEAIRQKNIFNEFTLMGIATVGAFCIGEYPEGVAVMLFYSIGELFQEQATGKARRSIRALLDTRPRSATVIRNDEPQQESPEKVRIGEIIEVKPGERVPLDGRLLEEQAAFNTSALTGESRPETIRKGKSVLAGMIATGQCVRLQVEKSYEESALSRILKMVQEANERKAPTELFIRRFARLYTPVVTLLAALLVVLPYCYSLVQGVVAPATPAFEYVFSDWLYRGLVFLVISCPCALVVSIPLAYFGGIGAASRAGILFKGGNYLDGITQVNTIVFDKTGTLTKGVFEVQELHTALPGHEQEQELLRYLASAEQHSTHPIARAVCEYACRQDIPLLPYQKAEEIPGQGLKTLINGWEVIAGNLRLLADCRIGYPAQLASIPDTLVACAINGKYAGYVRLADAPKEDAQEAISSLKALNINNIQMLSGDKQTIVSNLAERLGIGEAYGDLLPEGKMNYVKALVADTSSRVAFVGDGINDAPVLALSHVGIAMGGLGSDAAIETADVVIQTDQPSKVATAIRIGKQTRRVVRQNIALAFGTKLLILALGSFGIATLWEAVFADVGVALLTIANAIRIKAA